MTDVAVETAYGKVCGSAEAGVYSFKGIPCGGPLGLGAVTHAFLKVTHRTGLKA
jgi:hypothetical protein